MYLSQLTLNPRSREAQRDLADTYEMHRTLARGWGDACTEARVLFRVEAEKNAGPTVLVQAKLAPNWVGLPHGYLLHDAQTKEWQPRFVEGQSLRFRLLANPTFAPKAEGAKNGTRRGLYREPERLDWLRRQAEAHGFALPLHEVTLRASGVTGRAVEKEKPLFRGQPYTELTLQLPAVQMVDLNDNRSYAIHKLKQQFSAARFDGTLRVTDPEKFARAVESGIGKARGYGFGLLSVARA
jgi:CRISPR system Cascade subunit CasE